METTIAWFWIIGIIKIIVFVGVSYAAVMHNIELKKNGASLKEQFLNFRVILLYVVTILLLINPIKINGTNSVKNVQHMNTNIELNKVLPEKKSDNSFEIKANNIKGITNEYN